MSESSGFDNEEMTSAADPVLEAVGQLVGALRRFSAETETLLAACDQAVVRRETGASYRDIARECDVLTGLPTGALGQLLDAVSEYRRCQARALYDEGLSMAEVGRLFGVSRQRIAVLLDDNKARPQD